MEDQYTQRLEKIELVLDKLLPEKPDASWLKMVFGSQCGNVSSPAFDPLLELAASLTRPGWDLVKRGGKRWRPLLMVLTAEAIAGESSGESALSLVPLVEFPHNASLIHDDIEDNSDERRGEPAVHLVYGTDTAINAGAFMYFLPSACLSVWTEAGSGASSLFVQEIWASWATHLRALHLGQAMDIAWHRDYHSLPGLDEYDRMCRLKTGCLARLAAVLGVYSAATDIFASDDYDYPDIEMPDEFYPKDNYKKLHAFRKLADAFGAAAEQLGVGFQILDDVKNLVSGVPGKKRGDDIVEGKKSLPVLLYLHRYPEKRDFAARCFSAARAQGTAAPEVEEFINALEKAGVLEEARTRGMAYIRESQETFSAPEIAGFPLMKEGRELLSGLVAKL